MPTLPKPTISIIGALQNEGIQPILYGSQGVSLFLGNFKEFGDIDLLVDNRWLYEDWNKLIGIMKGLAFELHDEHEHEFSNSDGQQISFASSEILAKDGIAHSLNEAVEEFIIDSVRIRTLKPEIFKKAYEFSAQDGYRKNVRGKMDSLVINLLSEYIKYGSDFTK